MHFGKNKGKFYKKEIKTENKNTFSLTVFIKF